MKLITRLSVAGVILLALTGCTTPPPVAEPSPAPTMTQPEEPAEPVVAEVIVTASGLELLDETGKQLSAIGWFDDPQSSIAILTDAFGGPPTEVPYPGHTEDRPGIDYTWGGFALRIRDFEPRPPSDSHVSAVITSAEANGVAIRTTDGVSVGSSEADAVGAAPVNVHPFEFEGTSWAWYDVDPISIGVDPEYGDDELFNYVSIRVNVDADEVTYMHAPIGNYGV